MMVMICEAETSINKEIRSGILNAMAGWPASQFPPADYRNKIEAGTVPVQRIWRNSKTDVYQWRNVPKSGR